MIKNGNGAGSGSASAITESHLNVDRTSLLRLCNPYHFNYFAIFERHNLYHGHRLLRDPLCSGYLYPPVTTTGPIATARALAWRVSTFFRRSTKSVPCSSASHIRWARASSSRRCNPRQAVWGVNPPRPPLLQSGFPVALPCVCRMRAEKPSGVPILRTHWPSHSVIVSLKNQFGPRGVRCVRRHETTDSSYLWVPHPSRAPCAD